jgi:hypothetical protein
MKSSQESRFSPELDARVTRFGLRTAAALNERSAQLPHDITERLRFAREQALERARTARIAQPALASSTGLVQFGRQLATASVGSGAGGSQDGGGRFGWFKWASVLPVALLVAGLMLVQQSQLHEQILATAEVDTALLSDHLPPVAYSDPGFAEFLHDEQE